MKRKILSLILALALCAGLAVPAFADGTDRSPFMYWDADTMQLLPGLFPEYRYQSEKWDSEKGYLGEYGEFVFERPDGSTVTVKTSYYDSDDPRSLASRFDVGLYLSRATTSELKEREATYNVQDFFALNMPGKYTIKSYPVPSGYEMAGIYTAEFVRDANGMGSYQLKEMSDGFTVSEEVWQTFLTDESNNTFIAPFVFLVRKTGTAPGFVQPPVSDTPSAWAVHEIDHATGLGLVPDNLNSAYTQNITRAEFCALAMALHDNIKGETTWEPQSAFTDTDDINVRRAADLGIVNGVGDNKFDPNGKLTREQAATMLDRLAQAARPFDSPLKSNDALTPADRFADYSSFSSWAAVSVEVMQVNGIMNGVGNNMFAPKDPYTREQSIVTMMRLYELLA